MRNCGRCFLKPSEIVDEIYNGLLRTVQNIPCGDWPFMTDEEKDKTKIALQIASIKQYLDEQEEKKKAVVSG